MDFIANLLGTSVSVSIMAFVGDFILTLGLIALIALIAGVVFFWKATVDGIKKLFSQS